MQDQNSLQLCKYSIKVFGSSSKEKIDSGMSSTEGKVVICRTSK